MKLITCRDCIYEFVCPNYNSCDDVLNVSDYCPNFKNKSDFVEVPCRCKDCRYAVLTTGENFVLACQNWGYDDVPCDKNDFCSRGERAKDINVSTK